MRGFFLLVLAMFLIACIGMVFAGGGKEASKAETEVPGGIKRGGLYVTATNNNVTTLDIQKAITQGDTYALVLQYNGFIKWEDGELVGDLVDTWEISSDGMSYLFRFKEGVQWHDGVKFTAEDARFSIQRLLTPPDGVVFPKARTVLPKIVSSVETVDDLTVRITLKTPSPLLVEALAFEYTAIVPKHLLEGKGQIEITETEDTIGTGPWVFSKYVRDSYWEVKSNPNYFDEGLPYMDGIRNLVIPDNSTAWAAFRTQDLHRTTSDLAPPLAEARSFVEQNAGKVHLILIPRHWQTQLYVNHQKKPWNDIRVRRAINLVLDRQKFDDLYWEKTSFLPSYIDPRYTWATYSQDELSRMPGLRADKKAEDIAEAKRLMAQAGLQGGIKTVITARPGGGYPDMAVLIAENLTEIGIQAEVKVVESTAGYALYQAGDFDLAQQNNGVSLTDPTEIFANMFVTGSPRNYGKWDLGSRWHELMDLQAIEQDPKKRKAMLREMEEIMWDQLPTINMNRASEWILHWDFVKGAEDLARTDVGTARNAATRGETLWLDQ